MKAILLIFVSFSCLLIPTNHPLMLSLLLVLASLFMGLILFLKASLWLFNATVLIYLGGMMILFLYISILSNDEKVYVSYNLPAMVAIVLLLYLLFPEIESTFSSSSNAFLPENIYLLYKSSYTFSMAFLIVYLLLTLFASVKFSESFKGTLMKLS